MTQNYLFSVDAIVSYLYSLKSDISPVRLHKTLYFMFGYYGATYGQKSSEYVFEGNENLPPYLFEGNFEAWKYGSVHRDIYNKMKDENYITQELIDSSVEEFKNYPEIKIFIDDLFKQINEVSEFILISRNHQDESWKKTYVEGEINQINNDEIIKEYVDRYLE